jgi:hypothetical protein
MCRMPEFAGQGRNSEFLKLAHLIRGGFVCGGLGLGKPMVGVCQYVRV